MFVYEKKLQYPVRIAHTNPDLATIILTQYGGPDGELGASLRYLSQRYSMPFPELKGLLTDIGTEGSNCNTIGVMLLFQPESIQRYCSIEPLFIQHTSPYSMKQNTWGRCCSLSSMWRSFHTVNRSRIDLQNTSLSVSKYKMDWSWAAISIFRCSKS